RNDPHKDVYAQHVLGSGLVDPAWPDDGRVVCAGPSAQGHVVLAVDGAGGAIVAWEGGRVDDSKNFAHHLTRPWTPDPRRAAEGLPVCPAAGLQDSPVMVADGEGGAFLAWQDRRNGTDDDLFATHVSAGGGLVTGEPPEGRALCVAAGNQLEPALVKVGKGA